MTQSAAEVLRANGEEPPSSNPFYKLLGLCEQHLDLFHSNGEAYASLLDGRTMPVNSGELNDWIVDIIVDERMAPPSPETRSMVRQRLASQALRGDPHTVGIRTLWTADAIYVDHIDFIVRITANGIDRITDSDLPAGYHFYRPKGILPLPEPAPAPSDQPLADLWPLLRISEDMRPLIYGFMLATFRSGPYWQAVFGGTHGSAKSTAARVIKTILDPDNDLLRTLHNKVENLMLAAQTARVLAFDNISKIDQTMGDGLARLITGTSISRRTLFRDNEQTTFRAMRPVILTGLGDVVTQADLADRSLILSLDPIPEDERFTEGEVNAAIDRVTPQILADLYHACSTGLTAITSPDYQRPSHLPRMADAAAWVTACEPGLGVAPGTLLTALKANADQLNAAVLEAEPIYEPLVRLVRQSGTWTGTPTELLNSLEEMANLSRMGHLTHSRQWPTIAGQLSAAINRIRPSLRQLGYDATQTRSHGRRTWTIARVTDSLWGQSETEDREAPRSGADAGADTPSGVPMGADDYTWVEDYLDKKDPS